MRQSGLGIASFIIALIVMVLMLVTVVTAGVLQTRTPGGLDQNSTAAIVVGLAVIGLLVVDVVGIALGIGALFQSGRKKALAIAGLCIAGFTVLGTAGLMIIGSM